MGKFYRMRTPTLTTYFIHIQKSHVTSSYRAMKYTFMLLCIPKDYFDSKIGLRPTERKPDECKIRREKKRNQIVNRCIPSNETNSRLVREWFSLFSESVQLFSFVICCHIGNIPQYLAVLLTTQPTNVWIRSYAKLMLV